MSHAARAAASTGGPVKIVLYKLDIIDAKLVTGNYRIGNYICLLFSRN